MTYHCVSNSPISCLSSFRIPGLSAVWSWWVVSICFVGSCCICSYSHCHFKRVLGVPCREGSWWGNPEKQCCCIVAIMWQNSVRFYREGKWFYFNTKLVSFHTLTPVCLWTPRYFCPCSLAFSHQDVCIQVVGPGFFAVMWKTRVSSCWVLIATSGSLVWQACG